MAPATSAAGGVSGTTAGAPAAHKELQPRQRLPPHPKGDAKIIIRPKNGLPIKELKAIEIVQAIIEACNNKFKDEDFIVRLRTGSNIIIASTSNEEVARMMLGITNLRVRGQAYEVNRYVAMPEDVKRAVIRGVPAGTPTEMLKAKIRVRTQGVVVLASRMLGKSETAVITFDASIIPKYVIFAGAKFRCYLYRPTRQVCYICCQQGHRSDVCPTPNAKACRQCGMQNPPENHQWQTKCLICGGDHATGSRDCKDRLKKARELRGRQHQSQQQQRRSREKKMDVA
ncbi:uncharacterized protein [Dermacentor albipictus]|uniref:uncharacterized protein n=1 Tax=Dermacentor albipictus TaxID=60249 RepID=UPI0038FCA0C1